MSRNPGIVDLYEQSRRSLNFLQGAVDYWQHATPYFHIKYDAPGARFQHNHWDQSENIGRFLYAAVFARIVCGMASELPVETCWKDLIYQSIPDGEALSFRPNPSPYDRQAGARDAAAEQVGVSKKPTLMADLWDNRSVFTGLLVSYENTGDEAAFAAARRMAERVKSLASWEEDRACFKQMAIPPGWMPSETADPVIKGQHEGGWISPLIHYHQVTGDEAALRLACGLGRAFVRTYGEILLATASSPRTLLRPEDASTTYGATILATAKRLDVLLAMNSHAVYHMLAGLVRLYRMTGERELLDWARYQFDGMLAHLCSETGWTREFMPWQKHTGRDSCETCSLADRIDTDIQLALAGYPEYWNDAQRCACNYMVEAQLTNTSWMPVNHDLQDDYYISAYRVRERAEGAYVGWGAPNDFVDTEARAPGRVQNCCGPHGAYAVYQLWRHAVRIDRDGVAVNLALSTDTPACSVLAHAPVRGTIELRMKIDTPVRVRIPNGVDAKTLSVDQDGTALPFEIKDGYVHATGAAGQTLNVNYAMRRETRSETIGAQTYTATWVDDVVLAIDPPGAVAPLYRRDLQAIAASYEAAPAWPERIPEIDW